MKTYVLDPSSVPEKLVHFVNNMLAPHLTPEYTAYVLEICRTFMNAVDADEDYFMVTTDDVLCTSLDDFVHNGEWVHSLSGDDMMCVVYTKDFAKTYLANVDFRHMHGVVVRSMYPTYKTTFKAIDSLPITSGQRFKINWSLTEHNFMRGFTSTNMKFVDIMEDYEKMMVMKSRVEADFCEKYGVPNIDIKDYKFIHTNFKE